MTASNGVLPDDVESYTVVIDPAPPAPTAPTITSAALPDGVVGTAYSFAVTATGAPAPTLSATGLPPGLALDALTGAISGTPTTPGSYLVEVTAANGLQPDAVERFPVEIAPASTAPGGTDDGGTPGSALAHSGTDPGSAWLAVLLLLGAWLLALRSSAIRRRRTA